MCLLDIYRFVLMCFVLWLDAVGFALSCARFVFWVDCGLVCGLVCGGLACWVVWVVLDLVMVGLTACCGFLVG